MTSRRTWSLLKTKTSNSLNNRCHICATELWSSQPKRAWTHVRYASSTFRWESLDFGSSSKILERANHSYKLLNNSCLEKTWKCKACHQTFLSATAISKEDIIYTTTIWQMLGVNYDLHIIWPLPTRNRLKTFRRLCGSLYLQKCKLENFQVTKCYKSTTLPKSFQESNKAVKRAIYKF